MEAVWKPDSQGGRLGAIKQTPFLAHAIPLSGASETCRRGAGLDARASAVSTATRAVKLLSASFASTSLHGATGRPDEGRCALH